MQGVQVVQILRALQGGWNMRHLQADDEAGGVRAKNEAAMLSFQIVHCWHAGQDDASRHVRLPTPRPTESRYRNAA